MVVLGWYSFHIAALMLGSVSSLSRTRDLNYYDGSRGRMDRVYDTRDEYFQRSNRPKRTPHSPNLWAKSSDSQGVSCPTRLRENSLDSLGDSDRMKEVVHIPCPKRKSSGAKVIASFRGKNLNCNSAKSHNENRGTRELFKQKARGNDLNQAVKQNAQWLILSSQDRVQKPNLGYKGENSHKSIGTFQAARNWNANRPLLSTNQNIPTKDRPIWRNLKGAKEETRKTQYNKFALKSLDGQLKPKYQAFQNNINAPPFPRLKETSLSERGQQFSAAPVEGYFNIGPQPPKNVQVVHPEVIQDPFPKKDRPFQNPYDNNRLLMNSYNLTYDGPHHYGPFNPSEQLAYSTVPAPGQLNPSFFQSHNTPGNGIQKITYTLLYNVSIPSERPKIFQNTNETRNGPWVPGSLEVDIPPGYPHQPKLPKTTTRSFEAVNIKDLPKGDQKIPSSNGEPNNPKGVQGGQYQYQPSPNEIPQQDSWRYRDGPYGNHQQQHNSYADRQQAPFKSNEKLLVTTFLEKTTQAYKGVFGKLKKEESKVKPVKPAKIHVGNAQARLPPVHPPSGLDESAPMLPQQEQPKLQDSVAKSEEPLFEPEAKALNSKTSMPLRTGQDRSLLLNNRGHLESHNISGDMSHILYPPVTIDASLFTNKAHKIASKFVSSEDVTYVPFRGVPPARNDEAFYDKNLNFLGKIDRPPLMNTKKRKWCKLPFHVDQIHSRLHADHPVGLYSEPVDFHSDMSAREGSNPEPQTACRHSRKCRHNRRRIGATGKF